MRAPENEPAEPVAAVEPDLAGEIEFLTVRAAASGTRLARARLRPLGLNVRSYSVLALAGSGDGWSQRAIAAYLDLDPSQVVSLVDELEAKGLLTREVDAADRRARRVRATPAGTDLLVHARQAAAEAEDEALAALAPEERAVLLRLLRRIVFAED